jgi:hypothetical protein
MILPWNTLSKLEKIPRIPSSIIDSLPPPVINAPSIAPPVVDFIAPPVIDVPSYEAPSYDPPTLNPEPAIVAPSLPGFTPPKPIIEDNGGRDIPPPPPKAEEPAPPPRPEMEVPFIGTVPLPYGREVALAGTTAIGATAAALLGKSIVEWLVKKFKPVVKKVMLKIKEKAGKHFTDYELQQFFDFENRVPEQKSVAKLLEKEAKAEKAKQLEAHLQRRRRRKR